jgi:hypothetical protein
MNLAGTTFRAISNSKNGSLNTETEMRFMADDEVIIGSYRGGTIVMVRADRDCPFWLAGGREEARRSRRQASPSAAPSSPRTTRISRATHCLGPLPVGLVAT